MAYLSTNDRILAAARWMREDFGSVSVTKNDIRAAVASMDEFLENNKVAINQAFPEPARTELTTNQKILILQFVLNRRLEVGSDG